jgi:hypothetical protein
VELRRPIGPFSCEGNGFPPPRLIVETERRAKISQSRDAPITTEGRIVCVRAISLVFTETLMANDPPQQHLKRAE